MLAGLRYIETRKIEGHEQSLKEIFTTRYPQPLGQEIYTACCDALLATTDDLRGVARLFALVGTRKQPLPSSPICEKNLKRLGAHADEVMLEELQKPHDPMQLLKLARMLASLSDVRSPEPISFWKKANEAQRIEAVNRWRAMLVDKGRVMVDNNAQTTEEP